MHLCLQQIVAQKQQEAMNRLSVIGGSKTITSNITTASGSGSLSGVLSRRNKEDEYESSFSLRVHRLQPGGAHSAWGSHVISVATIVLVWFGVQEDSIGHGRPG